MTRRRVLIALVIILAPIAAHAIWDQIEATLFARDVARLAARGEPTDAASLESVPSQEAQRRAAYFYAAAANLASWKHRDDRQLWSREREVERALTAGELDRFWSDVDDEPALGLLGAAAPLDFAGFGPPGGSFYENASPLVQLGAMNGMRTDILAARGHYKEAAEALALTLRLQRAITRQYYRADAARRYFGSLSMLLRRAPPDAAVLLDLQRAFEALPDQDGLAQETRLERARLLAGVWPYPPNNTAWALRLRAVPAPRTAFESLVLFTMRPSLTRVTRSEVGLFDRVIQVAEQPWPQKIQAARALASGFSGGKTYSFASWRFNQSGWPARLFQGVVPLAGQELAIRRIAIATLAMERYRRAHGGAPAPTLDSLVPEYMSGVPLDPFTGKPLRYLHLGDAYIIYSVDKDLRDDQGAVYGFGSGRELPGRGEDARKNWDLGIRIPLR